MAVEVEFWKQRSWGIYVYLSIYLYIYIYAKYIM